MSVVVRKTGNNFTVIIPSLLVESMNIHDGQEMEVGFHDEAIFYRPIQKISEKIMWEKYESNNKNLRDGMNPDQYVRNIRDYDR